MKLNSKIGSKGILAGLLAISTLFFPIAATNNSITNIKASNKTSNVQAISKLDYSKDVIYQIVTDRFYDGDKSNNPPESIYDSSKKNYKKYWGGDFKGITDKINEGYFTDLGVTALWISQPVENIYSFLGSAGTSYHGYWSRDFKKTNPFFGSENDFDNLVKTAHSHNIKVIIDFAPNHTSPASAEDKSYAENGALYDNGKLVSTYYDDKDKIFHHNGGTDFSTTEDGIYRNLYDLADLNHQNKTVDKYFKDAIKKWLDKGIDGIRLDAVKHMPFGWQKSFMSSIYGYKPVFTFGEWYLASQYADEDNTYFANNNGMSLLDFRYVQSVRRVLRDNSGSMYDLDDMFTETAKDYEDLNSMVTFIDNHDMDRFSTGSNNNAVNQALVITMTSRGIPAIYYGTEQYMTGNGDPYNRDMMKSFNKDSAAFKIISKLSKLRKNNSALGNGTTKQRWINDDVYIYERKCGKDTALIAVNKGSSSVNISGLMTSMPDGTYEDELSNIMPGSSICVRNGNVVNFDLKPESCAVWSYTSNSNTPFIGNVQQPMAKTGDDVVVIGDGFGKEKGSVYFGSKSSEVVSWTDDEIKVKVPNIPAGKVNVKVKTSSGEESNVYGRYDVITNDLINVRFALNKAYTNFGENVYLVGSTAELGSWNTDKAIGPLYNQVEYKYPSWYYDVAVPKGTRLEFKFIKKDGSKVTWESGDNHVYTVPDEGTGQVIVDWK